MILYHSESYTSRVVENSAFSYDNAEIKRCAQGHWQEVLQLVGIPSDTLDGKGHPCPKCGGTDRFTFTNMNGDGSIICRKCGEHIGDGFDTIQWFCGCDFPTALKTVAEYFHIPPANRMNSVQKSTPALSVHSAPTCTPTADDPKRETGHVEHIYRDIDESGQTVERYRVSRINYDDGSKLIRKPKGFTKARDAILYHLDQIKRDTKATIYFVEGEKDADRLTAAGYLATTCGASGDWKPEYKDVFRNREVVLFFDCDEPGKKLANEVLNAISSVASTLRVVNLEPPYRDTLERLRSLVHESMENEMDGVNQLIGMNEEDLQAYESSHSSDAFLQDDPLRMERRRIIDHPPKGPDISDYLDALKASRSLDSDWGEMEERSEIQWLVDSEYTIKIHPESNLQEQLSFLDWAEQRNEPEQPNIDSSHSKVPFDELHQDGDFPAEVFPKAAWEYIMWNAKYFNQPYEVIGVPLLAVIAGVIGNKRNLRIDNDWLSPSPIWVLLHGSASAKKTPILDCVIRLVNDYDKNKITEYIEAYQLYESQMTEYKKAASKKADGKNEREKPKQPFNESFMVESSTVEGIRKKMESNGGYIFVFDDEFKGFTGAFNQYNSGNGVDVSFWNKTYNGKTGRVLRAGSLEQVIPNATASVLGGIQTQIFEGEDFLRNEEFRNNGFLARYLIVGIESKPIDQDRPQVPENVKNNMNQVMEYLFKMRWSGDVVGESPRSLHHDPVIIDMDSEAKALFWADHSFYDNWYKNRPDDTFSAMIGKFGGGTARIALALHCLKCEPREEDGSIGRIDKETMKAAIRINFWCAYEWYLTFFGLKENNTKLVEQREEEEKWIQRIRECNGIPKAKLRETGLTSEQKRMTKNLLSRGLLVEESRKQESGQTAKYIVVATRL